MSNLAKDIENAILDILLPLRYDQTGGYLRMLNSYAGKIDDMEINEIILFPCCLLKYKEVKSELLGSGIYEVSQVWSVIAADSSYTSEKGRRQGNDAFASNPGVYKILDDVKNLLQNQVVYTDTHPIELIYQHIPKSDSRVCIGLQDWRVRYLEESE